MAPSALDIIEHLPYPCIGLRANQEIVSINSKARIFFQGDPTGTPLAHYLSLENFTLKTPVQAFRRHTPQPESKHSGQMIHLFDEADIYYYQLIETPSPPQESDKEPPLGLWSWEEEGDRLKWSRATHTLFEIPHETPLSLELYMGRIHPDDHSILGTAIADAQSNKPFNIKHRLLFPDGRIKYVQCLGQRISSPSQPTHIIGSTQELPIHEREFNQQHFKHPMVKQARIGYLLLSPNGEIKKVNPHASLLLGKTAETLLGQNYFTLLSLENPGLEKLRQLNTHEIIEWQTNFKSPSHTQDLWLNSHLAYLSESHCDLIATLTDITHIKTIEERLKLALQGSSDGLWDWNLKNNHVYYSPRWKEMLGYSEAEIPHHLKSFENLLHPEDKERVNGYIGTLIGEQEQNFELEFRLKHKEGHYIPILSRGILIVNDANENPERLIGTHVDLSFIKENERQLTRARQEAEQANLAKSLFLANMSHELRTPLNSIIGFTSWLEKNMSTTHREKLLLQRLETNAHHLHALINDILDLSKLETGHLSFNYENTSVKELVKELAANMQPLIKKNQNTFNYHLDKQASTLYTAPLRLKQILLNLLSNAAKFTHQGNITFRIYPKQEHLYFEVEDTGIGITETFIASIFENFSREDQALNRIYNGTGLGLAISKKLSQHLGGELSVKSVRGAGSTFTLKLPLQTKQSGAPLKNAHKTAPLST